MKGLLHRVLSHAQLGGDLRLCWPTAFANEEFLQPVEQERVARDFVLSLQSREHLFQRHQSPAALVKLVSAERFRQLKIGRLGLEQSVQGNVGTSLVSLNSAGAVLLASEETFQRHKQIRTQTSFLAADRIQVSVLKQTRKEVLNQILRLFSCK